jgi:hypothetical protein
MALLLNSFEDLRTIFRIVNNRVSEFSLRVEETLSVEQPIVVVNFHVSHFEPSVALKHLLEIQRVRHILFPHGENR